MGGQLFTVPGPNREPPLAVPRLPPCTYNTLKQKYIAIVSEYYTTVASPIEAPCKSDHGDIDIMVEDMKERVPPGAQSLARRFQAVRIHSNGCTTSFAVPLPPSTDGMPDSDNDLYLQLDIHTCPEGYFQWEFFMHSYGDLWQILGVCFRPLGITANDKGFHLKIQEIESTNRKKSLIFLSKEPDVVMAFLGLDVGQYDTGFDSEDHMFAWIAGSRFFSHALLSARVETANDRQRSRKRGMYRRFVEEWIPSHSDAGVSNRLWTREGMLTEALSYFDKEEEHRERIMAHRDDEEETKSLWPRIKDKLREHDLHGKALGLAVRSLRYWVTFKSSEIVVRSQAQTIEGSHPQWATAMRHAGVTEDALLDWIESNWRAIVQREAKRTNSEEGIPGSTT